MNAGFGFTQILDDLVSTDNDNDCLSGVKNANTSARSVCKGEFAILSDGVHRGEDILGTSGNATSLVQLLRIRFGKDFGVKIIVLVGAFQILNKANLVLYPDIQKLGQKRWFGQKKSYESRFDFL